MASVRRRLDGPLETDPRADRTKIGERPRRSAAGCSRTRVGQVGTSRRHRHEPTRKPLSLGIPRQMDKAHPLVTRGAVVVRNVPRLSWGSTIPDAGQSLRLAGCEAHLEQPRTIHELNLGALVASPRSRYCAIQISA